jgi:protein-tyrosine phosphatase
LLLLTAAQVQADEIVADYLETVRLGDQRAALSAGKNVESELDEFCRTQGTTTEGAFRAALEDLDLDATLTAAGLSSNDRGLLHSWRGHMTELG